MGILLPSKFVKILLLFYVFEKIDSLRLSEFLEFVSNGQTRSDSHNFIISKMIRHTWKNETKKFFFGKHPKCTTNFVEIPTAEKLMILPPCIWDCVGPCFLDPCSMLLSLYQNHDWGITKYENTIHERVECFHVLHFIWFWS